jgi:uncharacterized membrane protein YbhN (UPF0104 family)
VKRPATGTVLRGLLGVVGLCYVVHLIRAAGAERVGAVLLQAGAWLPLVIALEVYQAASDFAALRAILGDDWRKVPLRTWLRSSVVAYAMMILVPAGRATGEVTRAALLSRTLGAPRAATTSTQLQAAYLSANGLLSLLELCFVAAFFGAGSTLALLLAGNVLFQAFISTGLLAILWDARVGRGLDKLRRRFVPGALEAQPVDPAIRRKLPLKAFAICSLSRSMQLVQYGVVLHAVGGAFSARGAVITHGIHLVGATLGDLVPNQLGVVDGMYRAFAGAMGFAAAPERALSIAFVVRAAQFSLATACVLVAPLTRGGEPAPPGASPASARADARS